MKSGVASRIYVKLIKLSFHIIIRVYVYSSVILRSELYVFLVRAKMYKELGLLLRDEECILTYKLKRLNSATTFKVCEG